MTNKVNFNTIVRNKVYFLVTFLILLSGSVQVSAQKLKIYVFGESNSKTAEAIENYLKSKIAQLLSDQYPCASTSTDDEATDRLEWARQRALMGNPNEDAISNVAGSLDAQFVVSVNVSQINSTIMMFANGLDKRRAMPVSKQLAQAHSEDEAVHAAESLAQEFVSDFIKSMPDCYLNEWVGTITYSRVLQGQSRTTEEGFSVSGTTTTEISTKSTAEANIEVRGTKRPARATVKWNEETLKNTITKQTLTCPGTTLFEQGKTVTRNVTEVEKTTGKAEGKVDAVASVSMDGDEYTISFTVPEIDNGIDVRDWTLEDSGGCGPPYSNHESNSLKWTSPELYEQAKGKIDHSRPDVLAGSQPISGGTSLAPSMEQTTIITWNLNFKRDPSTKK